MITKDAKVLVLALFQDGIVLEEITPQQLSALKFVMMVLLLEEKRVTMVKEISTDVNQNALDQEEDGNVKEEMGPKQQLA